MILVVMAACGNEQEEVSSSTEATAIDTAMTAPRPPAAAEHQQATLTFRVIDAPNGTFGYEILSNGALYIQQANIPGQPGQEGCGTREEAERLAAFVIEKIRAGISPPTVTSEELRTLGIIDRP